MIHLGLYALLVISLYLQRFYNLSIIPQLILLSPLLFQDEKSLGFKNFKKGLTYGSLFLPFSVPYLLSAQCYAFVLNQLGIAFAEEIFFRGFLMQKFSNFTVSLMFTSAHLAYWANLNALLTFFPSLFFGWLYRKTDSVIAPAFAHFSANMFYFFFIERFPELGELLQRSLI